MGFGVDLDDEKEDIGDIEGREDRGIESVVRFVVGMGFNSLVAVTLY